VGAASLPPTGAADLIELRAQLRAGVLSVAELLAATLQRIADTARFHAFTVVDEGDVAEQVRVLAGRDAELPLYGMPIAVKDLIDQIGYPTTSGVLRSGLPPADSDAPVVAALRSAGAVLVGRTNLDQMAAGVTSENPHFGFVGNPHDIRRIAGGSSGGSAACVVLGSAAGAVGTDTGGSIRIPAALCGAVGLKPSFGAVSTVGVRPLAWSFDHVGPIARSVRDALLLFHVMAGRPGEPEPLPAVAGLRFATLGGYFVENVATPIRHAVERSARILAAGGLRRTEIAAPAIGDVLDVHYTIYPVEAATAFADRESTGAAYAGTCFTDALDSGERTSGVDFLRAQQRRAVVRDQIEALFGQVDLLLVPTTGALATWRLDTAPESIDDRRLRENYVRLCCPFNQSGHPAISVPAGEHDGLPIGVQLVGRLGAESTLAAAASLIDPDPRR
jgi:aspartyl-tRNA(Asn)/glutamyl-tRNA(Gln) amidotransferase subunit A